MNNFLSRIVETKKEEAALLRSSYSRSSFTELEFYHRKCLSLYDALSAKDRITIIAEIKRASPSKGILRENFNHMEIADTYFRNGADAVSVLTDSKYFQGSIIFLADAARKRDVPLLRKDFIIDEFQILEAKGFGADAVLLIAELLDKNQIAELTSAAHELGLSVLLEFHSPDQLDKLNFDLNKVIGINNRNLETFHVDINVSAKAARLIPGGVIKTAESGIRQKSDVEFIKEHGLNAVLVGEYFMKTDSISDALTGFKEWCRFES